MRLSRIWRILQVEQSVIHRGRRPRWITPSEICRIFHILRKPNTIIALLFIQNIIFAQTCNLYSRPFLSLLNNTALCPGFLGQWFNNLWRQWFNNLQRAALLTFDIGSIWQKSWSTAAVYGKLCVWFEPIRNGKIFWMNNNKCYSASQFFELPYLRSFFFFLRSNAWKRFTLARRNLKLPALFVLAVADRKHHGKRNFRKRRRHDDKLQVPKPNTTRHGKNSVKYLTAITWNKISDTLWSPNHIVSLQKSSQRAKVLVFFDKLGFYCILLLSNF